MVLACSLGLKTKGTKGKGKEKSHPKEGEGSTLAGALERWERRGGLERGGGEGRKGERWGGERGTGERWRGGEGRGEEGRTEVGGVSQLSGSESVLGGFNGSPASLML